MSAKTKRSKAAKPTTNRPHREPTHDEIALCAMAIWVEAGRPQGRDLEHWLMAETHLRQACQADADVAPAPQPRRSTRHGPKRSQPPRAAL